jgi:probable O-glycosylation ligase (exosortase A-associated)
MSAQVRDLGFVGFLLLLFGCGLRRPFLFVLGYAYIDIVSPQRLSYFLLNSIPISLIFFAAAVLGWAGPDDKRDTSFSPRQFLMVLILAWAGYTTVHADFPLEALDKWAWVWKSLVFAIFLPLTLRTRLRMEALLLFLILSAAWIIITGGIKTLASGGGYGSLNLGLSNNTGLYEGSIISTFAVASIPVILFLAKYSTIYPRDWRVRLFSGALIFACLLIPVGTEARTGLVCVGVLGILMLRNVKRRLLYIMMVGAGLAIALPLLPSSYSQRMETIQGYQGDQSASTRIAVWKWTWEYVQHNPLGGGFEAYRQNRLSYKTTAVSKNGNVETVTQAQATDAARAYHSSYFEMLGEQGWPGFLMWLLLHLSGLFRMEMVLRRYRKEEGVHAWIAPLAGALQSAHIIYMVGSLFVGIAFQSYICMLIGVEIGLSTYVARLRKAENRRPWAGPPMPAAAG